MTRPRQATLTDSVGRTLPPNKSFKPMPLGGTA
jgi:hypothetical protein